MTLSDLIKQYAYTLGADLVGIGGIDRCAHAPLMMSPQGLMPGARSVVVMAVRHPDACIELGGEAHPQAIGPYSVQYLMNQRLDEMSYRMGTFIERQGYGAIPIASSNIWRYNQYKDLTAIFAPDISHIYMAVVAGLADIGYSGLALTPEFGARNRFVTVVTDAALEADPLIPPGTVCDRCMQCRRHCPSGALSKEIDGDKVLRIDPYEYRFANKNLWRCAWGEHFDLDLDLTIPDVVTEAVILEQVAAHGLRGGEMGQCLKYCLPRAARTVDRAYSSAPVRAPWQTADATRIPRGVLDRLLADAAGGTDGVLVHTADDLRGQGIDLEAQLPGARSAVTLFVTPPAVGDNAHFRAGAGYQVDSLCYDLTRGLDDLGFRTVLDVFRRARRHGVGVPELTARILDAAGHEAPAIANTVVTRLPLRERTQATATTPVFRETAKHGLTEHLVALARELGADIVGVAPVPRVDGLVEQLRPIFDGEELLDAQDRAQRFMPWEPEVLTRGRRVLAPADHLPGARTVLVLGLRMHRAAAEWATRPPAEAVGPYAFQTYATHMVGAAIGYRLVQRLADLGYQGVLSADLTGTDSTVANPRGPQPDLWANRFAGLAAGLGYLTTSGYLATPQFGILQRCLAIVTDAPLAASPLYAPTTEEQRCLACDGRCLSACPARAFLPEPMALTCEGRSYPFHRTDGRRCDWSKRYALLAESGFGYLGSPADVPTPDAVTPEALAAALRQHDPIKKHRPVIAEPCLLECAYVRSAAATE
jgi:epoxyqueuosine reductase QueG